MSCLIPLAAFEVSLIGHFSGVPEVILASLPMIKNAGSLGQTGLTPLVLLEGSIDTAIYFLILRFSIRSGGVRCGNSGQILGHAMSGTVLGEGRGDGKLRVWTANGSRRVWSFSALLEASRACCLDIAK